MSAIQITSPIKEALHPARGAGQAIAKPRHRADAREDATWVRWLVIAVAVGFLGLFIVLPLVCVLTEALAKGVAAYFAALTDPDTLAAIRLTFVAAAISVAVGLARVIHNPICGVPEDRRCLKAFTGRSFFIVYSAPS